MVTFFGTTETNTRFVDAFVFYFFLALRLVKYYKFNAYSYVGQIKQMRQLHRVVKTFSIV